VGAQAPLIIMTLRDVGVKELGIDDRDAAAHVTSGLPELLRAAFEWLPTSVVIVNEDGVIVLTNRELGRLFGYDTAELLGQSIEVLVPDSGRLTHAGFRLSYFSHAGPRAMGAGRELYGRRKDGAEIAVEIGLSPIAVGGAQFVLASVVDITERRRLQHELRGQHDERLQFEALVSELGAELGNVRPEDVDRTIEESLGRVVRTLDLDRSSLFQIIEDTGDFVHTHQWTRPGWASPPLRVSASEQFPWHLTQIRAGELVRFTTVDDVPNAADRDNLRRLGTKAGVTIPITRGGRTWGAVSFAAARESRTWQPDVLNRLRVVALLFANVLARKQSDEALRRAVAETVTLRDRLRDENAYLRHELKALTGASTIVGYSPAIRHVLEQVRHVAVTDSTVLILGETGTG
jgi:PAS domain S-box-containing protein